MLKPAKKKLSGKRSSIIVYVRFWSKPVIVMVTSSAHERLMWRSNWDWTTRRFKFKRDTKSLLLLRWQTKLTALHHDLLSNSYNDYPNKAWEHRLQTNPKVMWDQRVKTVWDECTWCLTQLAILSYVAAKALPEITSQTSCHFKARCVSASALPDQNRFYASDCKCTAAWMAKCTIHSSGCRRLLMQIWQRLVLC